MSITTLEFLRLVVPEEGEKFVSIDAGSGTWKDRWVGETHEQMAAFIERQSHRAVNIYHANATFADAEVGRKQQNARYLKTLWLDLDVQKKKGDSYESQDAALAEARRFVKEAGIPKPTMVVSSGMGLHIYWVLSEAIEAERWQPLADALKALTQKHNLLVDRSVISDKARVLRPVGTTWHDVKEGSDKTLPVELQWFNQKDDLYSVESLEEVLLVTGPVEDELPSRPDLAFDPATNAALYAHEESLDYGGSDPQRIANECGQLARFRKSGDLTYDIWRLCVGVLIYAEGGKELIHEWSANGYSNYSYEETQAKIDTWRASGASRCATFRAADPNGPCSKCPNRCNSPIALGYGGGAKPVIFKNLEGKPEEFNPITFPDDAKIGQDGKLYVKVMENIGTKRDPDFIPVWKLGASLPFYINSLAIRVDGKQESDVVFFPREREMREFVLSHEVVQDARALSRALNSVGIFGNAKFLGDFIVSYIDLLKQHVADTHTYQQMGWIGHDQFLIGNRIIMPTGNKEVRVSGHMAPKANLFEDEKDGQEWVDGVNQLYNLPNGEPYQFAICAAFASTLVPILDAEEFNGIPIALTSDESGYGKSTVCKIALSAFGRVERNKNVLTGDEVSSGAVEVQCSTFNNVPHLFDEMTNKSGQDTSHILYMLSNGVARARLKQDGTPRPASAPWRGMSFITGNKNIFQKLTEARVNPEAAQMRVFEIPLENYPKLDSLTHASDFIELTNSVRSGYGEIAAIFLRHVMENRKQISKDLWQVANMISKQEGVRHGKERFYIYTVACTLVSAKILRELGLVGFNLKRLTAWSLRHMASMRDTTNEYLRTPDEDFSLMLATFIGSGQVVSTCLESEGRSELQLRGMPVIRLIRDEKIAVLSVEGFHEYCIGSHKSPMKFRKELIEAGCFDDRYFVTKGGGVDVNPVNFMLGRGVRGLATGISKCYVLNFEKVIDPLAALIPEGEVVDFGAEKERRQISES